MGVSGEMLEILGVGESPNVFVLGVNEPRVTIYSQQCRALNLAWALKERGRLGDGTRVAVVGGGIAGTTFAAAAGLCGGSVRLMERAGDVMHIQRGSNNRWIHPHVYEWPVDGWDEERAGLPLMDWSADTAGNVVKHLKVEWEHHVAQLEIEVETNVLIAGVDLDASPHRVRWNTDRYHAEEFDLIVLAVGFGSEKETPHSHSYWHDDDLHQVECDTTLISGIGDGGLTDVMRAALADFQHRDMLDWLRGDWVGEWEGDLLALDDSPIARDVDVSDFYLNTLVNPALEALLAKRVERRHGQVVLNGRGAHPLDRRSAPLNRLLVGHLLRVGVTFEPGELRVKRTENDQVVVNFDPPGAASVERAYSRVVVRHGPSTRPLEEFGVTPNFTLETGERLTHATDRTRHPAWGDDDFVAPEPVAEPATEVVDVPPEASDWEALGTAELEAAAAGEHHLDAFVDGQDPEWSDVLPNRAPERAIVREIIRDVASALNGQEGAVLLRIGGPSGEGKSTVLMQVVARLASGEESEPLVMWRSATGTSFPWASLMSVPTDRPVLIASDRGQDLKRVIARATKTTRFRRLLAKRSAPIAFLIAASDVDWDAIPLRSYDWGRLLVRKDPHVVVGLTRDDAALIVEAMQAASDPDRALGRLGNLPTREAQVDALVASAEERRANKRRASLLGALLQQRTGQALEEHVQALMTRLADARAESGHSLLRLYLHVGALQFHSLGAIDRDTLAEAADIHIASVEPLIARTLLSEITVRLKPNGWWFRIRHDEIARTVFDLAHQDKRFREDLLHVHRENVRAVVALQPDAWRDRSWGYRVFYLSNWLVKKQEYADLAIAAAEGALAGAPENLYLTTNLAAIYRRAAKAEGAARGAELLADAAISIDSYDDETGANTRYLFTEWAACVGMAESTTESAAGSLLLGLHSIDDALAPYPLHDPMVVTGLSEIGRALLDLRQREPSFPATALLTAVVAFKDVVKFRPGNLLAYERAVDRAAVPDLESAVQALEAARSEARAVLGDVFPAVAAATQEGGRLDMLRAKFHLAAPNVSADAEGASA